MATVRVADIIIGDRLREEMGDIAGLAQSIADYGLFHPIIITRDMRLICGHRRVLAAKRLEMIEIEATVWDDLDEETRRDIEREENERRKPLTDYERSKRLVTRAEEQGPVVAARMAEVFPHDDAKPQGGRPSKYGAPKADVANALGVSEPTLERAEAHVSAVNTIPALHGLPQAKALRVADALQDPATRAAFEAIPEPDRPVVAAMIGEPAAPDDGPIRILRGYAALPPERREDVREAVARKDMGTAIPLSVGMPPMPQGAPAPADHRMEYIDTALRWISKARQETHGGHPSLAAATDALLDFRRSLEGGGA